MGLRLGLHGGRVYPSLWCGSGLSSSAQPWGVWGWHVGGVARRTSGGHAGDRSELPCVGPQVAGARWVVVREGLLEGGWVPGDAALCVDNGNSKDDF